MVCSLIYVSFASGCGGVKLGALFPELVRQEQFCGSSIGGGGRARTLPPVLLCIILKRCIKY